MEQNRFSVKVFFDVLWLGLQNRLQGRLQRTEQGVILMVIKLWPESDIRA